jgi:hypothetical protein
MTRLEKTISGVTGIIETADGSAFVDPKSDISEYDGKRIDALDTAGKIASGYIHHNASDDSFVQMTYSATGGGIEISTDANLKPGVGNFSMFRKVVLPTWKPAANTILIYNQSGSAGAYHRYSLGFVATTGYLYVTLGRNSTNTDFITTTAPALTDGVAYTIGAVVTRETATTAGSVDFYINGVLFKSVAITAATTVAIEPTGSLGISCVPTAHRITTINHYAILYNRALTAAEVLSLYQNGIAEADKWGSQTALTSGTLTVGKKYRINIYVSDDDFANVGAASNASGVEFTATGTTPTKWTNSSTVVQIGATLALEPEGITASDWQDSSTNNLDASYPATGYSIYPDGTGVRIASTANGSAYNFSSIEDGFSASGVHTIKIYDYLEMRFTEPPTWNWVDGYYEVTLPLEILP